MTHPEELLAGYVDDSLTRHERAEVDAHLASCDACREEIEIAGVARARLRALPEVPVPVGVTRRVISEASGPSPRRASSPWRGRAAAAIGIAAAIALVAGIAVTLPHLAPGTGSGAGGGGGIAAPTSRNPAAEGAAPQGAVPLEIVHQNYDPQAIQALAADSATLAKRAAEGSTSPQASPTPAPFGSTATALTASAQDAERALDCVQETARPGASDRLVRLIQAKWQGTPAYIAVFNEGPGAGQPADKVIVWVIDRATCSRILSFAQQAIR